MNFRIDTTLYEHYILQALGNAGELDGMSSDALALYAASHVSADQGRGSQNSHLKLAKDAISHLISLGHIQTNGGVFQLTVDGQARVEQIAQHHHAEAEKNAVKQCEFFILGMLLPQNNKDMQMKKALQDGHGLNAAQITSYAAAYGNDGFKPTMVSSALEHLVADGLITEQDNNFRLV